MHPALPHPAPGRLPRPLLLAAGLLLAQAAAAQSSVTISGIVDMAARSVHNEGAGSRKSLVSGSNSTSRLIFTGTEDLGNGLSAGFHLEHGFLGDTGTPAAAKFWDRRSTLSLVSRSLGELRLGRDFVPSYTQWSRYDPFAYVGVARSANFVSGTPTGPIRAAFGTGTNTTVRADNLVQWFAPRDLFGVAGLDAGLAAAPSEGGSVADGQARLIGLRVGYNGKGLAVSAARTTSENAQTALGKFTDTVVGGSVDVARVKLSAAWREFDYGSSSQTLTMLAAVTSTGAHEFKASWVRANFSGKVGATVVSANDARRIGLGYVHTLSRRTALYATVAWIENDGAQRLTISDGPGAPQAGGSSRGYELGLRHRF